MKDPTTLRMLADLGMDDLSHRALPLLALVHVAWADGEVQDAERKIIAAAVDQFDAGEEGRRLVDDWLRFQPSAAYLRKGCEAFGTLLAKEPDHGFDKDVGAITLDLARQVAKAAGGVFGIGATSRAEQQAIDEWAAAVAGQAAPRAEPEPLAGAFGGPKGPNRVTITFSSTTTMEAAASGGVLEADGQKYPIDRKGLVVGSGEAADLKVEHDADVKAAHCRFHETNRKFYVTATDGAVFVNGERVSDRRLIGGETVRVGQIELVFKLLRKIPKQLV